MRLRVKTSIVLALIIIPAILYGGWPFNLLIGAIALIGSVEIIQMAKINSKIFPSVITYIGTLSVVYYDYIADYIPTRLSSGIIPILSVLLLLISTVIIKGYNFTDAGISALTIFYIGLGAQAAVTIRNANLAIFIFIVLVIIVTDIGAYFIGSKIGKRKLAPLLSPNKSIEGSLGGIFVAVIIAAIYLRFIPITFYSYATMLFISIILSITGQFGDLLESAMKRHFQVKDSGTILPGHGGILDRFDSMLFTLTMALVLGVI